MQVALPDRWGAGTALWVGGARRAAAVEGGSAALSGRCRGAAVAVGARGRLAGVSHRAGEGVDGHEELGLDGFASGCPSALCLRQVREQLHLLLVEWLHEGRAEQV